MENNRAHIVPFSKIKGMQSAMTIAASMTPVPSKSFETLDSLLSQKHEMMTRPAFALVVPRRLRSMLNQSLLVLE